MLVVLALSLGPGRASAQPPPGDTSAEARKAEAQARYARAKGFYEQRAWDPALAECLASRRIFPTSVATAMAARSLVELGRLDEALDLFEALVRDFGDTVLKPEAKDEAQRQILALRAQVGTIEIDDAEPGARVVVDGRDRGELPLLAPLRVTTGSHLVRVFRSGFEPFEDRVEVAGRQSVEVRAALRTLLRSGRLRVAEQGGGALDVLVDGSSVGKTPWEGPLTLGEHTVSLHGEGDLGAPPVPVAIELDHLTSITLAAEALTASLRVVPSPITARVAIDRVPVGRGIWEGRLRKGAHVIEVAAEGFAGVERKALLDDGGRADLGITLERDPDSPFWRKPARPGRFIAEIGASSALLPIFGGDVANGCTGDCTGGVAVGTHGVVRGGYELGSGLGFGVTFGWLTAWQGVGGRSGTLGVVGPKDDDQGTLVDRLLLRGLMVGGWIGYLVGEKYPVHFRLESGALLGTASDARTGELTSSDQQTFPVGGLVERHDARFVYVAPEVRVGVPLSRHLEIGGGVELPILIAAGQATWSATHAVHAGTDGYGTFPAETLTGKVLVVIAPGVTARYDF